MIALQNPNGAALTCCFQSGPPHLGLFALLLIEPGALPRADELLGACGSGGEARGDFRHDDHHQKRNPEGVFSTAELASVGR